METLREKLVSAIMDLAGDEYETTKSVVKLAKMSEEELTDNLINIAEYYRDETNNPYERYHL
jgi:hypothetical protein